mgnify:CR=1 FL=1
MYNAGTEREKSFGLQWDETPFRSYDPQLGRFHQIDLLADVFTGITPYNYAFNDPAGLNDPTGLCPDCPDPSKAKKGDTASPNGVNYTFDGTSWVRDGESLEEITVTAKRENDTDSGTPSTTSPSNKTVDGGRGDSDPWWWMSGAAATLFPSAIHISSSLLRRGLSRIGEADVLWEKFDGNDYMITRTSFEGVDGLEILKTAPDGSQSSYLVFPSNSQTTSTLKFLQNDGEELVKTYQHLFKGDFKGAMKSTEKRYLLYRNQAIKGVDGVLRKLGVSEGNRIRKYFFDTMKDVRDHQHGATKGASSGSAEIDALIQIIMYLQ